MNIQIRRKRTKRRLALRWRRNGRIHILIKQMIFIPYITLRRKNPHPHFYATTPIESRDHISQAIATLFTR
ncbi:hypothetical protein HanPI659440_Chr15g0598491 [Helianthus annuus]|nr:hypothetical protein HanPI659440_Chr15g0598491 [Helianthus annuus]